MNKLLLVLLLVCSAASASDTARVDGRIVTTGMSVAEVRDRVGGPDRIVTITNLYGAGIGERWEFYRGRKQVNMWMQRGKVARIDGQ